MNLLGAKLYDPAVAVSKVTTSLLAMTAFDTTNLRISFTVPAHGFVRVKMACVHHGSTTNGQHLLGVLEGSTVRGRVGCNMNLLGTAVATTQILLSCDFTVAGLSPGAVSWDAAYGVEIVASANGAIKYGGPNDTTTNNAFGAFVFEIWDPQPLKTGLDGGVNVTQYGGSAGTFSGGRPEVNTSHAAGVAWASGAITAAVIADNAIDAGAIASDAIAAAKIAAGAITAAKFAAGAIDATAIANGAIDAATFAAGAIDAAALAADAGTEIGTAVWATAARTLTAATNITSTGGTTVPQTGDSFARIGATGSGLTSLSSQASVDTIDGIVDAILLDTAEIGAAGVGLTNLGDARLDHLDADISSRMATFVYTAPDNASIGLIKVQTDKFTFSVANVVDANILAVNNITVDGAGTAGDPWGPV